MKKNNKKKRDITTTLFILSCTIIPLVQWLIFYVYTNFSSFFMAFTNKNGEITLDNFVRFFSEFTMPTSNMSSALVNTLITFSLLFISYPFKVLVSYFLYKQVPGHRFYRIAFFLPSIIFSVAIASRPLDQASDILSISVFVASKSSKPITRVLSSTVIITQFSLFV